MLDEGVRRCHPSGVDSYAAWSRPSSLHALAMVVSSGDDNGAAVGVGEEMQVVVLVLVAGAGVTDADELRPRHYGILALAGVLRLCRASQIQRRHTRHVMTHNDLNEPHAS